MLSVPGDQEGPFFFFFSKTTSHATRYRSVVTTTYIASWKFEARRNVFKSLAPFSLTGASYYISHSRRNFLGFTRQKRIPHTRRRVEAQQKRHLCVALAVPYFGNPDAVTSENEQHFVNSMAKRVLERSRHYIKRFRYHQLTFPPSIALLKISLQGLITFTRTKCIPFANGPMDTECLVFPSRKASNWRVYCPEIVQIAAGMIINPEMDSKQQSEKNFEAAPNLWHAPPNTFACVLW